MNSVHVIAGRPPIQNTVVISKGEPKGYQQLTVADTAVGLSVPSGANRALIQGNTASCRWRDDGANPTNTTGVILYPANFVTLETATQLNNFKSIRTGASSAVLEILYYAI